MGNDAASAAVPPLGPKRQPMKQSSRRGLSAFYTTKSQSFNCITDLQRNPFCQSAVQLGKRSMSQNSWQQAFSSIQEDMADCDNTQQPQHCVSEPGSPMASAWDGNIADAPIGGVAASWLGTAALHQQPQFSPDGLLVLSTASTAVSTFCSDGYSTPLASSLSPCDSMAHSITSSCNSSTEAGDDLSEITGDVCCCTYQLPTEGLCSALQAAKLATR